MSREEIYDILYKVELTDLSHKRIRVLWLKIVIELETKESFCHWETEVATIIDGLYQALL